MSDPKIRYAIDPDTHSTVDARAGILPKKHYECIKCGGRLIVRQGPFQIWHFAHYGGKDAKNCPLYYGGQYENLLRELRTSEIETAEREKLIRLVVIPPPYGRTLRVCGVLPTIDRENVPEETEVSSLVSSIKFQSDGVISPLIPGLFHPRNAEVLVELDPAAKNYGVWIDTEPFYPALAGQWKCGSLQQGDVFAGEPERAEKIKEINSINEGEMVYVFLTSEPVSLTKYVNTYRAGPWYVISFELYDSTAYIIEELLGQKWQNPYSFYADVVLPADADPRSQSPIIGEAGSDVLVAIIPPKDVDPKFEVVSIPLQKGQLLELPRVGKGIPRWYRTQFPDNGSRRLSIHWIDRHRTLHLHTSSSEGHPPDLRSSLVNEKSPGLQEQKEGSTASVKSWSSNPIQLKIQDGIRSLQEFGIAMCAPSGFKFNVVASFEERSSIAPTIRRKEMDFEDLDQEFRAWIQEGLKEIVLDFDTLGSRRFIFESAEPWKRNFTDKEIREYIRKMDRLPQKARWSLVRQVFGAPPGTSHLEFPDGIKKRVRHALKEVQDERWK